MNLATLTGKLRLWLQYLCNKHIKKRKCSFASPYRIGWNTRIHFSKGDLFIGKGLHTKRNVHLAVVTNGKMTIGSQVFLNQNCILVCKESITIGDGCIFGPNVCIYDHDHRYDQEGIYTDCKSGPITIGKGCWIGAGAIILRNTTIGDGCVIGAGTVVKGEIPAHCVVTSGRNLKITPLRSREPDSAAGPV